SGHYVAVVLEDGVTVKQLLASRDRSVLVLHALNQATAGYPRVLSRDEADHAQWWHVDWWWGHQPGPERPRIIRPVTTQKLQDGKQSDGPRRASDSSPVDPERARYLELPPEEPTS